MLAGMELKPFALTCKSLAAVEFHRVRRGKSLEVEPHEMLADPTLERQGGCAADRPKEADKSS